MLDLVAEWTLDAAPDAPDLWDLPVRVIERGKADKLCLVTAARGGGKTTFARQVAARAGRKHIVKSIAVTGEALALMRHVDPSPGGAVGLARYLVHLAALEALLHEGVLTRADLGETAAPAFVPAFSPHLARLASLMFDGEFLATLFSGTPPTEHDRRTPREQVGDIADMLAPYLKKRAVHVLFDETRSKEASSREFNALKADGVTALLEASLADKADRGRGAGLNVTVLCGPELARGLPQDLYTQLSDRRHDLEWDEARMELMAGYRLERAERPKAKPDASRAAAALAQLFEPVSHRVANGDYARVGPWPYIWRRTRARPRDVVHLFRAIAQAADARGLTYVTEEVLGDAEHIHSDYMRAAIADELRPSCPEIDDIISGLSDLKARLGEAESLASVVQRSLERTSNAMDTSFGSHEIIHLLFKASAIGNRDGDDHEVYRCVAPHAELNWGEPVVVHPALAASLALADDGVEAA